MLGDNLLPTLTLQISYICIVVSHNVLFGIFMNLADLLFFIFDFVTV